MDYWGGEGGGAKGMLPPPPPLPKVLGWPPLPTSVLLQNIQFITFPRHIMTEDIVFAATYNYNIMIYE